MATQTKKPRRRRPTPAPVDLIRIVPLHHGALAAPPAAAQPKLTYRNGPLLGAVEVFTVFWGDAWKSAPQNAMIPKINAFFDFILTSPLIDQLVEYNTSQTKIGHGRRTGTVTIAGRVPSSV